MSKRPTAPMPSFDTHLQKQSHILQFNPIKLVSHTVILNEALQIQTCSRKLSREIKSFTDYAPGISRLVPLECGRKRSQVKK